MWNSCTFYAALENLMDGSRQVPEYPKRQGG